MLESMFQARQNELFAAEKQITNRMQWAQFARIERLETALRAAKERLFVGNPTFAAKG